MNAIKLLPSVPRSKGCTTCVKRHVKCDGRRPVCVNCDRLKRPCEGYRRNEVTFLNDEWKSHGVSSSVRANGSPAEAQRGKKDCRRIAGRSTPTRRRDEMRGQLNERQGGSQRIDLPVQAVETVNFGRPLPSLVSDKMSIYIAFFLSQFSASDCNFADKDVHDKEDFIHDRFRHLWHSKTGNAEHSNTNRQRRRVGPLLPAAEGLVKAFFAKRNGDKSLLRDGISAYGSALKRMREQIEHMQISTVADEEWEDTVFACLVLGLYELDTNTSSTNWRSHFRALANVIEQKHPEGVGLEVLFHTRLFIILEHLATQEPTFLSFPEWKHVLKNQGLNFSESTFGRNFGTKCGPRSYYESLLDEITIIPGLLASYNETFGESGQALVTTSQPSGNAEIMPSAVASWVAIEKLRTHVTQVLDYIERLLFSVPFHASEMTISEWLSKTGTPMNNLRASDSQGPIFNNILYFSSHEECNFIGLALSVAIALRLILSQIRSKVSHNIRSRNRDCKFVSQHPITCNSSDDDHGNNDAILVKYVTSILRSVDYHLLPANFGCGPFFFILPLRMARTVLLQERDVYISHSECKCIYAKRLSDCIRQEVMTERCLKEIARTKIVVGF